jgi:hypothetical protein
MIHLKEETMSTRFLVRQNDHHTQAIPGEAPEGSLDAIRTEGSQMLAAADDIIQRTLAGSDSESFLRATRQAGGE